LESATQANRHRFAGGYESKLWLFGGYDDDLDGHSSAILEFDVITSTWRPIETKLLGDDRDVLCEGVGCGPPGRSRADWVGRVLQHGAFRDKIYLSGGWDRKVHSNELYELDVGTRCWARVRHDARREWSQHRMVIHNDRLYIVAGFDATAVTATDEILVYRLKSKTLV